MNPLERKVAIVTGASRGLGFATAQALARAGAHVVLAARTASQIDALAATIRSRGGSALPLPTDVSNSDQVHSLVNATINEFGRVDILINNAALNRAAPLENTSDEDIQLIVGINLTGALLCARAVYTQMVKQRSGTIVNVGSVLSMRPNAMNTIYCATKFALLGFSRCLMIEGKNHNVRVIAFSPGGMATSWYDSRPDFDTSRMMNPDSVAAFLVNALQAPDDMVPYEIIVAPTTGGSWP